MPMNFPDSPTVGATFTSGSTSWVWNGTTWKPSNVNSGAPLFLPLTGGTLTGPVIVNFNPAAPQPPPPVANNNQTGLQVSGGDGKYPNIIIDAFAASPQFRGRLAGGTGASPTFPASGAVLAQLIGLGWTGSTGSDPPYQLGGSVNLLTAEAWTATACGTRMTFGINVPGSKTGVTPLTLVSDGGGGGAILGGNYLTFTGQPASGVNATGGPLIYADANNIVVKAGGGTGGLIFQDNAGNQRTRITAASGQIYINNLSNAATIYDDGNLHLDCNTNMWLLHGGSGQIVYLRGAVDLGMNVNAALLIHDGSGGNQLQISGSNNVNTATCPTIRSDGSNLVLNAKSGGGVYLAWDAATNIYLGATVTVGVNTLTSTGEVRGTMTTGSGQFRLVNGNYGSMFRQDGATHYILLTNSGDQYGQWNNYRPFSIDNASGNITLGPQSSDARLKTAIRDLPDCLELVNAITPKRFKWTSPPFAGDGKTHWGFVAQDVGAAMQAAGHDDFGGYSAVVDSLGRDHYGLRPDELTVILWKAVQELTQEVALLKARL